MSRDANDVHREEGEEAGRRMHDGAHTCDGKPEAEQFTNGYRQRPDGQFEQTPGDDTKPDISGAVLKLADWLKRPLPPPDFLMGDWVTTTSRVILQAPTGLGKTMFLIAAGMRTAAGLGFLHWKGSGKKRRVLYIDGEMSKRLLKERLEAEVERLGLAPEGFHALSYEDIPDFQPLNTPAGQSQIEAIVEAIGGVDLIIFDNIMSLLNGDMKEEEPWRQTMSWVRNLTTREIGQIWAHHTGHDESHGYGSKPKEWIMDTVTMLQRDAQSNLELALILEFTKARERTPKNREDFKPLKISIVDDQWTYETLDAKPQGTSRSVPLGDTALAEAFHEVAEAKGEKRSVKAGSAPILAVRVEDLREEFYSHYVTGERDPDKQAAKQQKAFVRAVQKAREPGGKFTAWTAHKIEWIGQL